MENQNDIVRGVIKTSIGYMTFTAILGIVLGLVMLFYPGGTMVLMEAAFAFFQIILTIFILYYTITEAVFYFKTGGTFKGILYAMIGVAATVLVWSQGVGFIFYVIAFFLIVTGIFDIVGGMRLSRGRVFLILLGVLNILIAMIILRNPAILPFLIAWYVLFWGISRLFLAIELRGLV